MMRPWNQVDTKLQLYPAHRFVAPLWCAFSLRCFFITYNDSSLHCIWQSIVAPTSQQPSCKGALLKRSNIVMSSLWRDLWVDSSAYVCLIAVALMVVVSELPPVQLFAERSGGLLLTHLLLEMFAVVVSVLVVIVAFQTLGDDQNRSANILVFAFTVVAGVDVVHAFSFEGMPDFLTPASTNKAIFFWLVGRSTELLAMVFVLARIEPSGQRWQWLVLALLVAFSAILIGNYHLDRLPVLFVPGQGVTAFKAWFEYLLFAGNVVVAICLYQQSRQSGSMKLRYLAVGSFLIGVGELAFTDYGSTSEVSNVLGHVYKVIAYTYVFRAIFLQVVRQPYHQLKVSEQRLREKEDEYDALVTNLPVRVARLDTLLRYRYISPMLERSIGLPSSEIVKRGVADFLPSKLVEVVQPHLVAALGGNTVDFEYSFFQKNGRQLQQSITVVPERSSAGDVVGVLAIVTDVTERSVAQLRLAESTREVGELKAALDAHAIVAVTDAQGVITRVNDKFCSISKYPRSELIGKTHRIINSAHHPKGFFKDLWATISGGEVWNGEICNRAKDGSLYWVYTTIVPFVGKDGVPEQYIAIRADITKRKEAEQEAQRMAFHDVLTGLPNRRLMSERVHQAIVRAEREKHHSALMLMDLDHFKEINDTLGHAQGDELLRQVAERLRISVRQTDTVARLGGDEFVVLLDDLGGGLESATAHAGDLGDKIRETLAQPYELHGERVTSTPSIGVVLFRGVQDDAEELLKQADLALYKAKEAGRNRLRFFDPTLQDDINNRSALLRDLRVALDEGQMRLYYQPVVDKNRQVVGVEALVRWAHPARGLVPPVTFIPLAEQTNLILPIGNWVLDSACAQIKAWEEDPIRSAWTVAVNVSARQFYEAEFVANVERALSRAGADPRCLRLELTESLLQSDLEGTITKMHTLGRQGVRFSLDDFGTGYSSLSYLKRLPLDQFKIDKSFVNDILTDPNDAAIAKTILALAASLDLGVVAEGVENAAQFDLLVSYGCEGFQGYLFSKPVPVDSLPTGQFM